MRSVTGAVVFGVRGGKRRRFKRGLLFFRGEDQNRVGKEDKAKAHAGQFPESLRRPRCTKVCKRTAEGRPNELTH